MIAAIVLFLVSIPEVMFQAFALSKVWSWFVESQYGAGPAYHSWYGLALCVSLFRVYIIKPDPDAKTDTEGVISRGVTLAFGRAIVVLLILGMAWCLGSITGWIS